MCSLLSAECQEAECIKVDRVLELLLASQSRLSAFCAAAPDSSYDERVAEGGLYVVQLCCLLLALLSTAGVAALHDHVARVFFQQDLSVQGVCCPVLAEWRERIDGGKEEGQQMQRTLDALLEMLRADDGGGQG